MSRGHVRAPCRPADDGSALVEFTFLAVLLLVPLVYLVVVVANVQRAAFAASAAVRDAGRAYVTAASATQGAARARMAAALALEDGRVRVPADQPVLQCSADPCDFAPGSTVTVRLHVDVPLPGLAGFLCSRGGCHGAIPVTATHTERIDCFAAGTGTPAEGRC